MHSKDTSSSGTSQKSELLLHFKNLSRKVSGDWIWKNISFENLKLNQLRKNVDIHMNSFAWTSLKIAQLMRKNKKKGSIIIVNSIYGLMGQDKNLYLGTNIKPNPVYSIIKSGLIGFVKNLSSYYGEFR